MERGHDKGASRGTHERAENGNRISGVVEKNSGLSSTRAPDDGEGGFSLPSIWRADRLPDLSAEQRALPRIDRHLALSVRASELRARVESHWVCVRVAAELNDLLSPLGTLLQSALWGNDDAALECVENVYRFAEHIIQELWLADATWIASTAHHRLAEEATLEVLSMSDELSVADESNATLWDALEAVRSALVKIASALELGPPSTRARAMPTLLDSGEVAAAVSPAIRSPQAWSDLLPLPSVASVSSVAPLLARTRAAAASGTLELLRGEASARVYIFNGSVARIRAEVPAAHLGVVAYELGLIDSATWSASLHAVAHGRPFGAVLLENGAVTRAQLWEALTEQMTRKLAHLVASTVSSPIAFRFYPGFDALATYGGTDWALVDPLPAIWRGIRTTEEGPSIAKALMSMRTRVCRLDEHARVERLFLQSELSEVIHALEDGCCTIGDLLAIASCPETVSRLVYCLAELGWVVGIQPEELTV
jgi:hypothetical protein